MTQVMQGVRILEVAQFTFVPVSGAILADWGADVIKVEHPVRGDAQRGLTKLQRLAVNPNRSVVMQHANRGKRSIGLDIANPAGRALLYKLAAVSDVFVTNFLPDARRRLKIDVEDLRKHNPKIIYARGSANGDKGPEREKGGFDQTSFWARGGSAMLVAPPELGGPLTQPGPAYGDTISGMNLAGGIAAALFHRERTGEPVEIDVSLLSSGVWATALSIDSALELQRVPFTNPMPGQPRDPESGGGNPFVGVFMTADGRYVNLSVLTPGPYIRDTFEHLGLPELADDTRFSTDVALMENATAARAAIAAAFVAQPFEHWRERLQTLQGQWAPYQTVLDAGRDPQVLANGFVFEVEAPDGGAPMKLVGNPVQFDHAPVTTTRAPEASEHTELALVDFGVTWDEIADLKASGAIA